MNGQELRGVFFADTYADSISEAGNDFLDQVAALSEELAQKGRDAASSLSPLGGPEGCRHFARTLPCGKTVVLTNPCGDAWTVNFAGTRKEAEQWASRHIVAYNPAADAIQAYLALPGGAPLRRAVPGLFDALPDKRLESFGIPGERLALVRSAGSADRLLALEPYLPQDAAGRLWKYLRGQASGRALSFRGGASATGSAFYHPQSRADYDAFSRMPLAKWRCFLSEEQREIVRREFHAPCLILGAAGTGKTVVALHRVKFLVEREDWRPDDKLLLTTFSSSLAADLRSQLQLLVRPEHLGRIEVSTLDGWVRNFLDRSGAAAPVLYDESRWDEIWKGLQPVIPRTLGRGKEIPAGFARAEFEQFILPEGILTLEDYLTVSRRGRGVTLGKRERQRLWPVFERARAAVRNLGFIAPQDAFLLAARMVAEAGAPYRAVVADEVQDFGPESFRLLRALARSTENDPLAPEGDLFLVGDEAQRIYSRGTDLKRSGVNVRSRRTRTLTKNYRTTAEIRAAGLVVSENNPSKLFASREHGHPYEDSECSSLRQGPPPELYAARGFDDEVRWISERIRRFRVEMSEARLSDFAVVAHSRERRDEYAAALAAEGLPVCVLEPLSAPRGEGVRVSTLHRMKGLEYRAVFIAGADAGKMPSAKALAKAANRLEAGTAERIQRALFYVASTRARDRLFISCREKPGEFMSAVASYLSNLRPVRDPLPARP